jgi:ribosomal protein L30/L7E
MDRIGVVKTVTGLAVGFGIESIVSNVIKDTTPSNKGTLSKVCIWMGGFVIAGMLINKALVYTDESIDKIVEYVNKTMVEIKEELR